MTKSSIYRSDKTDHELSAEHVMPLHFIDVCTYRYTCVDHMIQGHYMWSSSVAMQGEQQTNQVHNDVHICIVDKKEKLMITFGLLS